jgi:hypothetical protein
MTNKSEDSIKLQQSIIGELYALSREHSSWKFEIFIHVYGHLNLVQIDVITNCDYAEEEPKNRLLQVKLDAESDNYTYELQATLMRVKALIDQHSDQSQLMQNSHQVASVLSVRSHPLLGLNV